LRASGYILNSIFLGKYEIDPTEIVIEQELGSGCFGVSIKMYFLPVISLFLFTVVSF
jgi:hypothetical protein